MYSSEDFEGRTFTYGLASTTEMNPKMMQTKIAALHATKTEARTTARNNEYYKHKMLC